MCLFSAPAVPKAPAVAPEPTRAEVAAKAAADAESNVSNVRQLQRRRLGVFGNVATTPLGDASYGRNVAAFGTRAA